MASCRPRALRAHVGDGSLDLAGGFLGRLIPERLSDLVQDREPRLALRIEAIQALQVIRGDESSDWDAILPDEHARLPATNAVEKSPPLRWCLGDLDSLSPELATIHATASYYTKPAQTSNHPVV
jgi:hypothetical protein